MYQQDQNEQRPLFAIKIMSTESTFKVTYQIQSDSKSEAQRRAEQICIEQTVEMPLEALSEHSKSFTGSISSLNQIKDNYWIAEIDFPNKLIGNDLTQFLNILFGNISLHHGIKILDVEDTILRNIANGPAFGIKGIRKTLKTENRALSCTALKPLGLQTSELAERAYLFASGGIDIIKDDHGLTNQDMAPFRARVAACIRAVRKGEQNSGKRTLYFPNITTSPSGLFQRFEEAIELGADGVLISPQLTGLEMMKEIADKNILPVMAHPSFSGSYTIHPNHGFSPDLYYGKLWRLFGADSVIYPNAGGRFSFNEDVCHEINLQLRRDYNHPIRKSFPVPAGGIDRGNIDKWIKKYGIDTILLIGGSLYLHPQGIKKAASDFHQILKKHE